MKKFTLGLFFLALAQPSLALDCAGLWANGFPDPEFRAGPVPCTAFAPTHSTLPSKIRMFITDGNSPSLELKEEMESAAQALVRAFQKFEPLGRLPNLNLVRYERPYYGDTSGGRTRAFSFINFYGSTESCPIFVYPFATDLSKEHYQQMIAHEVFHCFQMENYPAQARSASQSGDGLWWFEGLAQYFGNYVYPTHDFEYSPVFGSFDPLLPFFEQSNGYLAENFFQSYMHFLGDSPARLVRLHGGFPSTPGAMNATVAMGLPQIKEALHIYAKELSETQVQDDSGAMSPYQVEPTAVEIPTVPHFETRLSYMDFTPGVYQLTFPAGARYTVDTEIPGGTATQISSKKMNGGDSWSRGIPRTLETSCREDTKLLVVITRASDAMAMNSLRLTIEREENEECACDFTAPPRIDSCLVGKWKLDHGSVADFYARMTAGSGFEFDGSSGGFDVKIDDTGAIEWLLNNWTMKGHADQSGTVMQSTTITNGTTRADIRTFDKHLICSKQLSGNLRSKMIMVIDGQTYEREVPSPFSPSQGRFTYDCSGPTLLYKEAKGVGEGGSDMTFNLLFFRVNE